MSIWTPLHLHTHYSMLDGLSKPSQIADRCIELGYDTCAVTDHGTISGAVSFTKAMGKAGIKPILGCEFYLSQNDASIKNNGNRFLSHLVVLAKNVTGWDRLIEAVSASNDEDLFYYKPRLDLDRLSEYCDGNLISFSGHPGSDLANVLFCKSGDAYSSRTYQETKRKLDPNWKSLASDLAYKYRDIFGKDNFFIEIQLIDQEFFPAQKVIGECLREVSKVTGIPCVATADSHYPTREDAIDQRVLLCSALKTTIKKVQNKLKNDEDVGLGGFFRSDNYHIPSPEEMAKLHTEKELQNSVDIGSMCEGYNILGKPSLPRFPCPHDMDEAEYLRHLCRTGWREKLIAQNKVVEEDTKQVYADRIKHELNVIHDASLDGYFLIVQDYVNKAKERGELIGPGRGSGAGCLISYLLGITSIDPIEYGLLFERFYNAGRNTEDYISLPDIDVDFPITKREDTINYIRQSYGEDYVCQMVTFSKMQGRGALKEVMRVNDSCSFNEMNEITDKIPQEAEISDQLQESGETSILKWSLINRPNDIKSWCTIDDDGNLNGSMASSFEQAIRLEGTFRSQGKHAAGVVIAAEPLHKVCPMIRDKSGKKKIAGMDMEDLEAMGHVKFDILGVALLDKMMSVNNLLEGVDDTT